MNVQRVFFGFLVCKLSLKEGLESDPRLEDVLVRTKLVAFLSTAKQSTIDLQSEVIKTL